MPQLLQIGTSIPPPPGPVTGITAVVLDRGVMLSWAPTPGAEWYELRHIPFDSGDVIAIDGQVGHRFAVGGTSATITGFPLAGPAVIVVRACNGFGCGLGSQIEVPIPELSTPAPVPPPTPPDKIVLPPMPPATPPPAPPPEQITFPPSPSPPSPVEIPTPFPTPLTFWDTLSISAKIVLVAAGASLVGGAVLLWARRPAATDAK